MHEHHSPWVYVAASRSKHQSVQLPVAHEEECHVGESQCLQWIITQVSICSQLGMLLTLIGHQHWCVPCKPDCASSNQHASSDESSICAHVLAILAGSNQAVVSEQMFVSRQGGVICSHRQTCSITQSGHLLHFFCLCGLCEQSPWPSMGSACIAAFEPPVSVINSSRQLVPGPPPRVSTPIEHLNRLMHIATFSLLQLLHALQAISQYITLVAADNATGCPLT